MSTAVCKEQGFTMFLAWGTILQGWALSEQGHPAEGIAQMRQSLTDWQATGARFAQPYFLALLANAYGKAHQPEAGLVAVAEAFTVMNDNAEHLYEAELYRLKGELTLQQFQVSSSKFQVPPNTPHLTPSTQTEAEACFLKAIAVARRQQAKSLELRATVSLARLWQTQGKKADARRMLAEIYGWFTEGFDTKDLQEAKALIEVLSQP
jgi:predicted ATPase